VTHKRQRRIQQNPRVAETNGDSTQQPGSARRQQVGPRTSRRRPVRKSALRTMLLPVGVGVLFAVALAGLVYAAATSGSPTNTGQAVSAGDPQLQAARAYASCMRSHGDPGFPDPNSQGNFGAITKGAPSDPTSPAYQAAQPSCASLMPQQSQQQQQQNQGQGVQFAQCMRSHGVANFPDPDPQGHFLISGSINTSPQYPAAYQACKALLPAQS